MLIIGAIGILIYLALLGNTPQVYTDVVKDYVAINGENKSIERNLFYIFSFAGCAVYGIFYYLTKKKEKTGKITDSVAAEAKNDQQAKTDQYAKYALLALIISTASSALIYSKISLILIGALVLTVFVFNTERAHTIKADVLYFMSVYTVIAIYRLLVLFGIKASLSEIVIVPIAFIVSVCVIFAETNDAKKRVSPDEDTTDKKKKLPENITERAILIEQVFIPFALLVYFASAYEYKGETYTENRNVRSYLFIGSDTTEEVNDGQGGRGSRGDASFLAVFDDEHKTWRILIFDRDSMVRMNTYNDEFIMVGESTAQLTLSHIFGTWDDGARNMMDAVSKLLWNQRIDGFFDMNMASISTLNDAVGGVTVYNETDFTAIDPEMKPNTTITLHGKQAEIYVRSRTSVDDGTNEMRVKRQKVYLKALAKKIRGLSSDDINNIYDKLMNNSVTNMEVGDLVNLAASAKEYKQLDDLQIDGEHKLNSGFMEFHLDQDSLTETILTLFYTKE